MLIRSGFRIVAQVQAPTPMLCALSPHPDAPAGIFGSGEVHSRPPVPIATHADRFGNHVSRITAPAGETVLESDFIVEHSGAPDPVLPDARQHPVEELPAEALEFLTPSRYCESDLLAGEAWARFGATPEGWARVQAICDFVHEHITFGYGFGRSTKTATEALAEGNGVCRDFAHLAIALCRAMNIPARYASGYLGDIGVPYGGPMDFCAWFEVWLGGAWRTFDARYNTPRIGRVLMVRGRDAADAAMITSFGPHVLERFEVWSDELGPDVERASLPARLRVPTRAAAAARRSA
jgi:transglutaminase-like putative cysteine protease